MPPPLPTPVVLVKTKIAYTAWLVMFNDFPKVSRNSLGKKIDNQFLELLESIFASIYLPPQLKLLRLIAASSQLDKVKFFIQLAWENKCVSLDRYGNLSEQLNEIGRMLGGWIKGLENKTPAVGGRNG